MKNIAIFASGSGTNTQNIIEYFVYKNYAKIKIVISNKQNAFVLKRAESFNIESLYIPRNNFVDNDFVLNILKEKKIDLIVLAGFLYLIPPSITRAYKYKIINIHPALLPLYGGKGMYGMNVHKAVKNNNEKYSGITIHYVNEKYDEGEIIFQAKCKLSERDTAESIAEKIHKLEYKYFPKIIDDLIKKL